MKGIVTADADLAVAASEVLIGSTSYNGQRCTAIKLVMLHESIADDFLKEFLPRISSLKGGLPWDEGVAITPLPEPNKTQHMQELIADAISKGAKVLNEDHGGGEIRGNLMHPAVVFPVTSDMLLWEEEQVKIFQGNIIFVPIIINNSSLIVLIVWSGNSSCYVQIRR